MLILIDTNIILRFVEPRDSEYVLVRGAVEALTAQGENYASPRRIWSSFGMFARGLYRRTDLG